MREHNNIIGIATCNRFRVFYFTRLSCYIWSLRSGLVCVGVPWRVLLRLFLPSTGCAFELCLQVGGPPHNTHWSGVLEHCSSTLVSTASPPMSHGMYSLGGGMREYTFLFVDSVTFAVGAALHHPRSACPRRAGHECVHASTLCVGRL